MKLSLISVVFLLTTAAPGLADALPPSPESLCGLAITAVAPQRAVPISLLRAISLVESGKRSQGSAQTIAWPWTINISGLGYVYKTKEEAIAAVRNWQASGIQSIDIGCMQINLLYHPQAFHSLEDAFDPVRNVEYAALFLTSLRDRLGNWGDAATAYHSFTPEFATRYRQKIMAFWKPGQGDDTGATHAVQDLGHTARYAALLQQVQIDRDHLMAVFGRTGPALGSTGSQIHRLEAASSIRSHRL